MKILLDHCVPAPLAKMLPDHESQIAYDLGWAKLRNGELIEAAQNSGLDLLLTSDKNLRYQQNLSGRRLAILVLPTNNWGILRNMTDEIADAIATMHPGEYRELKLGNPTT